MRPADEGLTSHAEAFLSRSTDRLTFQSEEQQREGKGEGGVKLDKMKDNILACRPRGMTTNTQPAVKQDPLLSVTVWTTASLQKTEIF